MLAGMYASGMWNFTLQSTKQLIDALSMKNNISDVRFIYDPIISPLSL